MTSQIHGYTYDENPTVSPVSTGDLDLLLSTLLWTEDDADALSKAGGILEPQIDDILDLWYGYVGSNPHLVASFNGANGEPAGDYLAAVRLRFAQWIRDLCNRPWDQQWLNYQHEVGRHQIKPTCRCVTSSRSSGRSRRRSDHFSPTAAPSHRMSTPCTPPGSRPSP